MISAVDADDIYKIPLLLHEQDLDDIVVDKLRLEAPPTDLPEWRAVVAAKQNPEAERRHRAWSASTCRSAIRTSR